MLLMPGVGTLLILLTISSIPAIAICVWFRLARYPFSLPQFFIALLAGAISFFPALLLQKLLAAESSIFHAMGKWRPVAEIFIRFAFTEEFSRLVILVIVFFAFRRFDSGLRLRAKPRALRHAQGGPDSEIEAPPPIAIAGTVGLIAGLGFAILESAVYGASSIGNALLRTFTAAPLHAVCAFRVGSSIAMFNDRPVPAVLRFLTAVIIHGIYNFLVIIPKLVPFIAAILIALSAFASSILAIRRGMNSENNENGLDTSG